jgi:hypothetical protein
MSLRNIFSRKHHKYINQGDIKSMNPVEIVMINPSEVKSSITKNTSELNNEQKRALNFLLSIKKTEKRMSRPNLSTRKKVIQNFLQREGYDKKMNEEMINKSVQNYMTEMGNKLELKTLQNRWRNVGDMSSEPLTEEEKLFSRIQTLKKGGRTKKNNKYKKRMTRKMNN